jgi:hypothetical protein
MPLLLSEAQILLEAVDNPGIARGFGAFLDDAREEHLRLLVDAVRKPVRDTMREAFYSGKVDAYETLYEDLRKFASEQMEMAKQ